jgi:hypothetical protein
LTNPFFSLYYFIVYLQTIIIKKGSKMKHKIKILILSISALLLVACAGKTPNPIQQYQPDDNHLTCERIQQEIADNHAKMMSLLPKQEKTGKNVGLGVAGAFFLVPLFFMDFSDAERIEIEAYQRRDSRLRILGDKRKCDERGFAKPIKFQTKKA